MASKKPYSFFTILPATLILFIIGWGGLALLFLFTVPTLGPRWLFFFCGVMALSGTAIPPVYFLNLRFQTTPHVGLGVILREAIWVGVYGSFVAWLLMGRVFTPLAALIFAGGLVLIEGLLRIRERARWNPEE